MVLQLNGYSWISMTPKPVPLRFALAVPPLVPVTVTVPSLSPLAVGLNTRDRVHDRPGAREALQLFVAIA